MKRSEASEQILLIQWCELQKFKYPELGMIFHVPNGGSRNRLEAINLKKQGVKAGVPDLFLPKSNGKYHGLFIEMKFGKNGTTENQDKWLKNLNGQGYKAVVCNGFEEAKETITKYMSIV
ncbi:VRR-NUC domain-containing protein [Paraclostridium sordellii]|uniref:VRR-NUC domain-containing protein n=1 Tax=Paraclostridium sordellii TaxID=1505 RepID=UPI0005DAA060|nr:VRR-NUC domain-containing protein [Paeniclostridium sordellii]CEN23149.1 VRR-NUC domain-containing protein [[Clostridium] sordellii] [Paeniclostridium sordellii]CEN24134.1 VRR-NUC domain-containing protein [[Clostridium] sordellii] [Paeniclostridium sordellii]CEN26195.1 VRR-NUC domain-containing protein [[Clostridium] sordellii] [Paeniclostridium sordellii]